MVMAVVAAAGASSSMAFLRREAQRARWVLTPLASSSFSAKPTSSSSRKLVLYSKPGCCLCDGLKEKLHAAFLLSGPDSLHDVELQVDPSLSFLFSILNLFSNDWFCFLDKGHYQQTWVGEGLPVWDTRTGQSTSRWHRGWFSPFPHLSSLLNSRFQLFTICM